MAKDLMFQDEIKDAVRERTARSPQAQVTSSPSGSTARSSLSYRPAPATGRSASATPLLVPPAG